MKEMWRVGGRIGETYNCLHDVCEVVAHCDKQCSLPCVGGADLVDPAQDEGTGAELGKQVSKGLFGGRGRQTYAKLAKPIDDFTAVDVLVERIYQI